MQVIYCSRDQYSLMLKITKLSELMVSLWLTAVVSVKFFNSLTFTEDMCKACRNYFYCFSGFIIEENGNNLLKLKMHT